MVIWAVFGIAGALIASNRGSSKGTWFLVSIVLGPIGVLMALTGGKRCPQCQSRIHLEAMICPKCQAEQPGSAAEDQPAPETVETPAEHVSQPWSIPMIIVLVVVVIIMIALSAEYR
jgi:hypothetical protein